jgi:MFS family permease
MTAAAQSRSRGDWLVVLSCLVCQTGMGVGGYIFPVFLKPVVTELGWSRAAYAWANPVMSTVVALMGPAVGWASDRVGPRPVLVLGTLTMSGALFAAGFMNHSWSFYVIAVFIGVGVSCLGDLPTGRVVAERFQDHRGLALGMVYIGSNIGGAVVPLLATALAAVDSWRYAFHAIGGGLWILLLPFAWSIRQPRSALPAPGAADDDVGLPRRAIRQRDFWLLFWVLFAFYLYRLGINVHLVAYLSDLGYSDTAAAGGFSLTLALGIAGKLLAGAVADRVGAKVAVVGNFTLIALASSLLLLPAMSGTVLLFLIIHGFSTAAEDVVIPLIIGQRFGIQNLARIYGILLLALVPGGLLGPVLAGYVFDLTGQYTAVFSLFAVCNVLAVAALLPVRSRPVLRAEAR